MLMPFAMQSGDLSAELCNMHAVHTCQLFHCLKQVQGSKAFVRSRCCAQATTCLSKSADVTDALRRWNCMHMHSTLTMLLPTVGLRLYATCFCKIEATSSQPLWRGASRSSVVALQKAMALGSHYCEHLSLTVSTM